LFQSPSRPRPDYRAACDTFRGVIDASEYKDFILVFLFHKYVSDVWKEHYQEADQRYQGDQLRIERKMARERFVIPKGASFDDLYRQRNADNIGELIDQALDAIAEANKAKIGDAFADVMFNSETKLGDTRNRNRRLKSLIEDFAKLDLRPSRVVGDGEDHKTAEDVIGEAYIYLIERFGSEAGKKAGEFYTPRQVARVLARIAAPQPGDRICDPACGSGSLLIKAAEEVGSRDFALFGQEVNRGTWGLARLNMFLHGIDGARLEWGDALNDPKLVDGASLMKFDVVVANPPFSLQKWGAENAENDRFGRFWRGVPPKSKGDWAFITHMIEAAKTREDVERYARAVSVDEVKENGFNLNIPRYVNTFEPAEEVDIAEVQKEIDALEDELATLRTKMREHLKELGLNV